MLNFFKSDVTKAKEQLEINKINFESKKYELALANWGSGGYDGATQTANYATSSWTTTPDDDISDLSTLVPTSRNFYKNNGFYGGVIKCAVDHTIGTGLRAKSTIKRDIIPNVSNETLKKLEDEFDNYFNDYANSTICDVTGKDNFYQLQRLSYLTMKKDGDLFALLPLKKIVDSSVLQIKLINSENVCSSNTDFVEGIKVNKDKYPLKYSIKQDDSSYKIVNAAVNKKKNVLHVFHRERPEQLRGIPFLTPVMRDISAIDEYMKYELTAAKMNAIFYGTIKTDTDTSVFGGDSKVDLSTGQVKEDPNTIIKENVITQLKTNEELDMHDTGRDNPNYEQFINTSAMKVAMNTRIPLEMIKAQFVSSYSASRAVMLQMEKFTKPERDLLVNSFCKPIRQQVLLYAVLSGQISVPNNFFQYINQYLRGVWIGDPVGSVDPIKDVKAKIAAINENLLTREKATSDLGHGDFEANTIMLEKEYETLKTRGLIIEESLNVN